MARYIDADGLEKAVKERIGLETGIGREINEGMIVAYAMIAMAPTLTLDDLRPKGQWLDKCVRDWHCSECGEKLRGHGFDGYVYKDLPNFCPNCGADMREGDTRDEVEIQAGV